MSVRRSVAASAAALLLAACAGETSGDRGEEARTAGPFIEFRFVSETAAAGLERAEWEGSDVYLEPEPVISNPDFRTLRAYTRPNRLMLRIELHDEGAARLEANTGSNIGRRMAMLIDGRVVSAPVIRDRIGARISGIVPIDASAALPEEEAEQLAAAINRVWADGATEQR